MLNNSLGQKIKQSSKIGIMGGSFDPPHNGHISAAHAAARDMQLSKVYFLPSFDVPKAHNPASIEDRLKMMHLACSGHQNFFVDQFDAGQITGTQTIRTLNYFAKKYPTAELYFIAGTDTINTLKSWGDYIELFKFAKFVAVPRKDCSLNEEELKDILQHIVILNAQTPPVSSTQIRSRILQNMDLKGLVPEAVEKYIVDNNLYTNILR